MTFCTTEQVPSEGRGVASAERPQSFRPTPGAQPAAPTQVNSCAFCYTFFLRKPATCLGDSRAFLFWNYIKVTNAFQKPRNQSIKHVSGKKKEGMKVAKNKGMELFAALSFRAKHSPCVIFLSSQDAPGRREVLPPRPQEHWLGFSVSR